ncbi:hypothetical protein MRX96_024669 [Rhipicephalus microplus]
MGSQLIVHRLSFFSSGGPASRTGGLGPWELGPAATLPNEVPPPMGPGGTWKQTPVGHLMSDSAWAAQIQKAVELTNEDLEFLKKHTDYDDATIRDWYAGFKQDCPTGKLSRAKFLEIYRMFFTTGNPEKFCDHVFRTFDADNNGHIDFKEFLLAIGA